MLSLFDRPVPSSAGVSRRELLRVGGLGFTGLLWSDLLRARAARAAEARPQRRSPAGAFGRAKACILIYNYGGPSQLDTLDLKPDAPREIRGDFQPIASRVPGIDLTEHLPRLATLSDRYAVIRSVNHRDNDHAIGAYLALTGHSHPKNAILGIEPPATPQDMPSVGSVLSRLRPADGSVFSYVTLGELRHLGHHDSMGQDAGCLGAAYDPFVVPFLRPYNGTIDVARVASVWSAVDRRQLEGRRGLLQQMDRAAGNLPETAGTRSVDYFGRRAFELLSSAASRDAFDLAQEPQSVHDFYGPTTFARNCLLARRLVEAGVPMITVYSVGNRDWDTHGDNFNSLKNTLLPTADQGVGALLEDLERRGLLEETLVVWMGEMGRTPLVNKGAGRDHWSFCYSILMGGGGIRGGQAYGTSDRSAAYPATLPVSPADVAATIHHCLGIDHRQHLTDQQGRPFAVATGEPVGALVG